MTFRAELARDLSPSRAPHSTRHKHSSDHRQRDYYLLHSTATLWRAFDAILYKTLCDIQEATRVAHETHVAAFIGGFFLSIVVLGHYERVAYKRPMFWLALVMFLLLVRVLPLRLYNNCAHLQTATGILLHIFDQYYFSAADEEEIRTRLHNYYAIPATFREYILFSPLFRNGTAVPANSCVYISIPAHLSNDTELMGRLIHYVTKARPQQRSLSTTLFAYDSITFLFYANRTQTSLRPSAINFIA